MDELLNDIQRTILLQYILPQVCSGIAVGIGGVTLAAVVACTIGALVKGQEIGIALCQLRGHKNVGVVHAEISQDALIELEA